MFPCNYCSAKFDTEQELDVHTETCRKNVPTQPPVPSPSKLHTCEFCAEDFVTEAKRVVHENMCELRKIKLMVTSQLGKLNSKIDNFIIKLSRQMTPTQCCYCVKEFNTDTMEEIVAHRKTCRVLQTKNALENVCTTIMRIWSNQQPLQISVSFLTLEDDVTPDLSPSTLSATSPEKISVQTTNKTENRHLKKSDDEQDGNNLGYDICRAIAAVITSTPIASTSKDRLVQKSSSERVTDNTKRDRATNSVSRITARRESSTFSTVNFKEGIQVTRIATNETIYHCTNCPKFFDSHNDLHDHFLRYHDETFAGYYYRLLDD